MKNLETPGKTGRVGRYAVGWVVLKLQLCTACNFVICLCVTSRYHFL